MTNYLKSRSCQYLDQQDFGEVQKSKLVQSVSHRPEKYFTVVCVYYRTIHRAPSCLSWYQVKYQNQKWSFMTSGGQIDRSWWLRLVKWVKCKQKSAAYLLAKTLTEITHLVRFRPDLGFGLESVLGKVWEEHQINFATTNLYHQIICFFTNQACEFNGYILKFTNRKNARSSHSTQCAGFHKWQCN